VILSDKRRIQEVFAKAEPGTKRKSSAVVFIESVTEKKTVCQICAINQPQLGAKRSNETQENTKRNKIVDEDLTNCCIMSYLFFERSNPILSVYRI
jgi:hypothetical protein